MKIKKPNIDNSISFWNEIEQGALSINYNMTEGLTNPSAILDLPDNDTTEIYLFANFDICNFTKYKREHHDWIKLLEKFLITTSSPSNDWTVTKFWKFNGDSLTFRKKVGSVDEICRFVDQAQDHLDKLQEFLNQDNTIYKNIYVKSAVWIAGFSGKTDRVVNNTKFCKSPFGEEFVGENIDEGFRLSSCSKAGKLLVDPKIVAIISLFCSVLDVINEYGEDFWNTDSFLKDLKNDTIKNSLGYNYSNKKVVEISRIIAQKLQPFSCYSSLHNLTKETSERFYLMEFKKCKGVWDDRDYPIFWYIRNPKKCEFVYDEIIAGESLRKHKICKLINDNDDSKNAKKEFEYDRHNLLTICGQIEVLSAIKELVLSLTPNPQGASEETIFDTANLYYMVACVVQKDGRDQGVMIFKRTPQRKHLKHVWDLVPIKHGRTFRPGLDFGICDYLQTMLNHKLNLHEYADKFVMEKDCYRNSIKPYALCNIYRNGENHNGVLCVAGVSVESSIDDFLIEIKNNIVQDDQYCDVKLINLNNICKDSFDITVGELKIRSLSVEEVRKDSNEVAIDPHHDTFCLECDMQNSLGISYLGYSIKQILEERGKR